MRPPNEREATVLTSSEPFADAESSEEALTLMNNSRRCLAVVRDTVVLNSKPTSKTFTFDYVAGETSSQEEVFKRVGRPMVTAAMEGYNATIFACESRPPQHPPTRPPTERLAEDGSTA